MRLTFAERGALLDQANAALGRGQAWLTRCWILVGGIVVVFLLIVAVSDLFILADAALFPAWGYCNYRHRRELRAAHAALDVLDRGAP